MALNIGQLTNQIQRVFDQQLDSIPRIASQIAQAYQAYALTAQAPPGAPVILKGSEYRLFEISLRNLMQGQLPAPQAAQGLGQAISGFWLTPPVTTGAGGVCTAIVPAAAISKMAATNVKASGQAAQSLASSLDLMTRTVFVTNPSPIPPGPLF
jgi:hypothetical protein